MQRPHDLAAVPGKPSEQHLYVQIVADEYVQMHDIWIYLVELAKKPSGDPL